MGQIEGVLSSKYHYKFAIGQSILALKLVWPTTFAIREHPFFSTDFKILTTFGLGWVGYHHMVGRISEAFTKKHVSYPWLTATVTGSANLLEKMDAPLFRAQRTITIIKKKWTLPIVQNNMIIQGPIIPY